LHIHSLNLIGNAIKDSKELSDFNELTALSLQKNGLVELKGPRSMKKLEVLDIRHNRITDYSPLFELKNLKKLYVDTEIPTTQFEALQQQLPQTTIIKS
jgi:Leucine-rich repeat (LRR) protein